MTVNEWWPSVTFGVWVKTWTSWFGGMLALTMIVAFLAEIFILPATIKLLPGLFAADRVHVSKRARVQAAS